MLFDVIDTVNYTYVGRISKMEEIMKIYKNVNTDFGFNSHNNIYF